MNYYKEAFKNAYNLIGLGFIAAVGLLNPDKMIPLFALVVPLELAYLYFAPQSKWFQRWLNLRVAEKEEAESKVKEQTFLKSLPDQERFRYQGLLQFLREIKDKSSQAEISPVSPDDLSRLESYAESYKRFLEFQREARGYIGTTKIPDLEKDVSALEKQVQRDSSDPKLAQINEIRRSTWKIKSELLERLKKLQELIQVVEEQKKGIIDTLELIRVKLLTSGFQAGSEVSVISEDIDKLLGGVTQTEKTIEDLSKDMVRIRQLRIGQV
jgi:phage terminase small subunit